MSWDTILSVQKCTQRFYKICKEIQMLLFLQLITTVLYPPQASTSFHFVSSASSSIFPDGFLVSLPQTQDHWFCMGKQNVHKGLNTWTIFAPFFWIQPTGGASYMFIEQGVGTGSSWKFSEDLLTGDKHLLKHVLEAISIAALLLPINWEESFSSPFVIWERGHLNCWPKCGHRTRIHSRGPQSGYCPNSWEGGLGMRLSPTDMLRDGWQTHLACYNPPLHIWAQLLLDLGLCPHSPAIFLTYATRELPAPIRPLVPG